MNNQLNKLDEILYGSLQPWLEISKPSEKFAPLVSKVPTVEVNFSSLYEFDFHRPTNPKTEYYYKLIVSETNAYCNSVVDLINADKNEMLQKRLYDDVTKNLLIPRFTDVIELIKEGFYFVEFIDPKNFTYAGGSEKKTETFIIQLLKVALVKIYLEIQNQFPQLNSGFALSERDIYDQFFNQGLPENSFLKRNNNKPTISKISKSPTISAIKPNSISRLSFTYKEFETNSDKLTDLFKHLKENGFIAKENPLANFKRAFSGKEVSNQVIWSGSTNEFHYFVYLIHNEFELIKPIKRNHWSVACKCFIRFDGTQFDKKKLKEGIKPKSTSELLDKAVELIK